MQGVVTTADLADQLGVRPETVVRWCRERQLRAMRREGRWLIPLEEAETFAAHYASEDNDPRDWDDERRDAEWDDVLEDDE